MMQNPNKSLPPSSEKPVEDDKTSSKRDVVRGKELDEQQKLVTPVEEGPKKEPEKPERGHQTPATPSGAKLVVSMDDLEAEIGKQLQGADSLDTIISRLTALSDLTTLVQAVKGQKAFANKTDKEIGEAIGAQAVFIGRLATDVGKFKSEVATLGRGAVHELRGFQKAWADAHDKLSKGMPVAVFVKLMQKQLQSVKDELTSKPVMEVKGGTTAKGQGAEGPKKDEAMSELEKRFDVLARKSAPPPDDKNNISEVDLAFLSPMRGFPDIFASLDKDTKQVDVSKANEEKVFSIGSGGALGFKGELSDKAGARFYGVLMPKGWIAKYGEELRERVTKSDKSGDKRSARAPNGKEMAQKRFDDEGHEITIGEGKAFGIRAEESTKEHGQVDVHRDRHVNLTGSGEQLSHLELFRKSSMGVVEFSDKGLVINRRMW